MLFYEVITFLLTCLSRLRNWYLFRVYKWEVWFRVDRDRPVKDHCIYKGGFTLECCDCGLAHLIALDSEGLLHIVPIRPRNYKYKFRVASGDYYRRDFET